MYRLAAAAAALALLAAAPAALAKGAHEQAGSGPDPLGVTTIGTGLARVEPPARPSEESIRAAVERARPQALSRAVNAARRRAFALAQAAGLTLGEPAAVHDDVLQGFDFFETGDERFCRRSRRTRELRCFVPRYVPAFVSVTFATRETDAAPEPDRSVTARGNASAPVDPANARSSTSIRRAVGAASIAALGPALAEARVAAEALGRPTGIAPGQVLAIADQERGEFGAPPGADTVFAPFGIGEFCGTVRRRVIRRDPRTGRRRVVRRVRERRCFVPGEARAAVRVTYASG